MRHIVSFSGGMGSFAEAAACVEVFGARDTTLLFADTLIEDYDLYRFMGDCVEFLGCEFIVISEGRTPFDVFKAVKFMGNTRIDPCSKILKREFLTAYIRRNYRPDDVHIHLGLDYSESHRLDGVRARTAPWTYRSLLVERGVIIPKDYSIRFGIDPPRLYSFGLGHNNCGGFCVKAGLGHYKRLLEGDRRQYLAFENDEAAVYEAVPNAKPFLRKVIDGELRYITLKDYRLMLENTPACVSPDEALEFGGCGCAV